MTRVGDMLHGTFPAKSSTKTQAQTGGGTHEFDYARSNEEIHTHAPDTRATLPANQKT